MLVDYGAHHVALGICDDDRDRWDEVLGRHHVDQEDRGGGLCEGLFFLDSLALKRGRFDGGEEGGD